MNSSSSQPLALHILDAQVRYFQTMGHIVGAYPDSKGQVVIQEMSPQTYNVVVLENELKKFGAQLVAKPFQHRFDQTNSSLESQCIKAKATALVGNPQSGPKELPRPVEKPVIGPVRKPHKSPQPGH